MSNAHTGGRGEGGGAPGPRAQEAERRARAVQEEAPERRAHVVQAAAELC